MENKNIGNKILVYEICDAISNGQVLLSEVLDATTSRALEITEQCARGSHPKINKEEERHTISDFLTKPCKKGEQEHIDTLDFLYSYRNQSPNEKIIHYSERTFLNIESKVTEIDVIEILYQKGNIYIGKEIISGKYAVYKYEGKNIKPFPLLINVEYIEQSEVEGLFYVIDKILYTRLGKIGFSKGVSVIGGYYFVEDNGETQYKEKRDLCPSTKMVPCINHIVEFSNIKIIDYGNVFGYSINNCKILRRKSDGKELELPEGSYNWIKTKNGRQLLQINDGNSNTIVDLDNLEILLQKVNMKKILIEDNAIYYIDETQRDGFIGKIRGLEKKEKCIELMPDGTNVMLERIKLL